MGRNSMKIKRLINCFIPVSICNFECGYCYIPQCEGRKKNLMPQWSVEPATVAKALSRKRLGGICFMNICGDGETLIPKEVPQIIIELLKEGHFIEVVTNGTLTNRFEEIFQADPKLLAHLEFKFSYHYEQLKKKNMFNVFWNNVLAAKEHGCSFTVELTPHDELIPYIDDIINDCIDHVGAKCHITTAYNYQDNFSLLTKLSREEYLKHWGKFESPMFDFKMSILGQKRKEYCYAGEWLMSVDLASGIAHQCYFGLSQNIYKNINKPLKWMAIGKHCAYPCCFNGHALMAFGAIPEFAKDINYAMIRNRVCNDGTEWLSPEVKEAFSSKFIESNQPYSAMKKGINKLIQYTTKIAHKTERIFRNKQG